jgi:hypothetical protein
MFLVEKQGIPAWLFKVPAVPDFIQLVILSQESPEPGPPGGFFPFGGSWGEFNCRITHYSSINRTTSKKTHNFLN